MRKTDRHYRYRPRGRRRRVIEIALGCLASVMLLLAAWTGIRSLRTARLNADLAEMHAEAGSRAETDGAEIPEQALESGIRESPRHSSSPRPDGRFSAAGLSYMGMPDGSAIPEPAAAPESTGTGTQAFHRIGSLDTILADLEEFKRINRDTAGWISIPGVVDLPVVYRDNTYYLNHDFYGRKNGSGTLFLDQAHPVAAETQTLLVHGHNMKDGSMFGMLTRYTDPSYVRSHSLITFSTLWEKELYQIFAAVHVPAESVQPEALDDYVHPTFPTAEAFNAYIDRLSRRALWMESVSLRPDDALLTLSTCIDDDRLVLVSRRVRN